MTKKLIGIVAALAVVAAIVFAVLHRAAYTSMLPDREPAAASLPGAEPTAADDSLSDRAELPERDLTRVAEEVPDTLGAAEARPQ